MRFTPFFSTTALLIFAFGFLLFSCNQSADDIPRQQYVQQINQWHEERIASLKEKDSWLSLAGLHKLEQGINTIGSDSSGNIILPPQAEPNIGTITFSDTTFIFEANPEVTVTRKGLKVDKQELKTDAEDSATILKQGAFLWYVIERRGDYYVRIKDTNHPNFASFDGIERFPVSQNWRVKAGFQSFKEPKLVTIPDVLGTGQQDTLYGTLNFTVDGKQLNIVPLGNPKTEDEFFIIFGDQTNGESTYNGGRYLYADMPDENGITYIDFNRAYNPPCVFTHFATCPLPPPENRLEIKITAGEKMYQNADMQH